MQNAAGDKRQRFESLLFLSQPGVSGGRGHALDAFHSVLGLGAAEGVQEELAALGLVQALFVAGRITELAGGALGNQLGSFGIVFNFANNLFHGISLSFSYTCMLQDQCGSGIPEQSAFFKSESYSNIILTF